MTDLHFIFFLLLVVLITLLGFGWLIYRVYCLESHLSLLVRRTEEHHRSREESVKQGWTVLESRLASFGNQNDEKVERTFNHRFDRLQRVVLKTLLDYKEAQKKTQDELAELLGTYHASMREQEKHQSIELQAILRSQQLDMANQSAELKVELLKHLRDDAQKVSNNMSDYLERLTGVVEERLDDGFQKSNKTFSAIIERLAMIDNAQKKITELSTSVVSLQEVLNDKRSRGAFGEIQLNALIENLLPARSYSFQYRLSNQKIVDCLLFLPAPMGAVSVDAKFPLESYKNMTNITLPAGERQGAKKQFKIDVKRHIEAIASKYILPQETASGAIMFVPAEAIFAEIHANHPDLVELGQSKSVWITSPTTLMAILTTAGAVLKDEATRKQVHIIQEHLGYLSKDFMRFQKRIDSLSSHMGRVNRDVQDVAISANKISTRFEKIENVELEAVEETVKSTDQRFVHDGM